MVKGSVYDTSTLRPVRERYPPGLFPFHPADFKPEAPLSRDQRERLV
jgi:hypothetical protein